MSIDEKIDQVLEPAADVAESVVFWSMPIGGGKAIPLVLIILGTTALFLTIYFRFINFRALGIAARTISGKYTAKDAPGQITHFQALSAALSATVGLGNIAGVAVAIAIGGPGATFWMILVGLCGMTTKFTECTLGVKYRKVDEDGKTRGGAMYYLQDGLKEMGMAKLGKFLAILFAIFCVAGAIGAGNMFQANQAHQQFSDTFGILEQGWQFGLIVALVVGVVIIGGIVWIARVTSFLVPFMCAGYMLAAVTVLIVNAGEIPSSIALIFTEAFSGSAAVGGVIGAIIQGIKRGVFSNEAGVGSAPIAHSAVKTDRPASEGLVALLEPFIDTVIVCTMTALVIISSGMWNVKADAINQLDIVTAPESQSIVTTVGTSTKFNLTGNGFRKDLYDFSNNKSGRVAGDEWTLNVGDQSAVYTVVTTDEALSVVVTGLLSNWGGAGQSKGDYTITATSGNTITVQRSGSADDYVVKFGVAKAQDTYTEESEQGTKWQEVKVFKEDVIGWVKSDDIKMRDGDGIWLTSEAFATVISWFPYVLSIAVILFAFSTLISWSYYAEQAVIYLFGKRNDVIISFKFIYCLFIILGAAASLGNVIRLADALFFCMVVPNLIGVYFLLKVVKKELSSYIDHVRTVDRSK